MKKFLLGIVVGLLMTALTAVVLFFVFLRLGRRPPHIPDASILVLRVEGELPEAPPMEIPLPTFQRTQATTVLEHWDMLRKAAADSRIRAVLLMPEGLRTGWAKLQQIRESLEQFKKSGKPLYAWLRRPGTREYYLATAAERLYLGPEDFLDFKGLRVELMYLKKTLDKIGVDVEVAAAGKYKDAPDMFTRTSMSPETREVMNSILDETYRHLVEAVAAARKQRPDDVRAAIDAGPFTAAQARAKGLVDGLQYEDQVFEEIRNRLKLAETRKVASRDYRRIPPESLGLEGRSRIALVVAEGAIVRSGGDGFGMEGLVSAEEFTRLLREIAGDGRIRGVIVRVDSPGGDGAASDEIWREMSLLGRKKPLVISMSDAAASGGYYIAATGDPIVAYPGTLTGSIGVFYGKLNLRQLYDKLGITKEILKRGRFAAIDSDYAPLGPEERAKLAAAVQDFYKSFVARVAESRKRKAGEIEPLAQGRVWLGSQARQNGLIDHLGGLDRAIELVKQKAGIPAAEKIRLVSYPPRRTILDWALGQTQLAAPDARLAAFLRRYATRSWLEGGVFRMMPYGIEVR
ncbi:MAG: signal peptide peptidase SppA [Acidobacteriota bacterium]